jgi:hypothetical protein
VALIDHVPAFDISDALCREDFLQFLVDNKCVYEAMEEAVKEKSLARFQNTGDKTSPPLIGPRPCGVDCILINGCCWPGRYVSWQNEGQCGDLRAQESHVCVLMTEEERERERKREKKKKKRELGHVLKAVCVHVCT